MLKKEIDQHDFPSTKLYFSMKNEVTDFSYDTIKQEDIGILLVDNLKFISEEEELAIKLQDKITIKFDHGSEGFETYYIANKLRYIEEANLFLATEDEINDVLEFAAHTVYKTVRDAIGYNSYLINCYFDKSHEYIYFKYRWFPHKAYDDLIKSLKENTKLNANFICSFKDKDERFDILKYSIPYIYKKDIARLLDGQYESFTDLFKESLYNFCGKGNESFYFKMLFAHDPQLEKLKLKEFGLTEWLTKSNGQPLPLRGMPNIQYYNEE